MEKILFSIKKILGIDPEYTYFDTDIILLINSTLMALTQIGVGPSTGFMITGEDDTWVSFLGDRKDIEGVKLYVGLKTRLAFDPPANSFLIEAIERQIRELEWRLNVQVEPAAPVEQPPSVIEEGGI